MERGSMNPANYSLKEVRKAVVSLFVLAAAVVGLFVTTNPDFIQACTTLIGAIFAVVGVFAAKNHTSDDLQKALEQFKGAALTVVGYFAVVPTDTGERAGAIIGLIVAVAAVYWTSNEPPPAPAPPGN
jgi:uncharacterized membrane protein HdeD (DUF308 family)